jgi:hypothetical protein
MGTVSRLVWLVLAAALVEGCYAPSASPGAPCSPTGECPSGQECRSGVCFAAGTPHDADGIDEAVFDAPMLDAALDAPSYVAWGTPVELTSLETSGQGETDPSVTADKLTAVLVANTAQNDSDIYIATRSAVTDTFTASLLAAVNATGFNEESPEISADGKTLYFVSNRSGAYEVYVSTFTTTWSNPTVQNELSSTGADGDVAVSPDGLTAVTIRDGNPNRLYIYTRGSTAAAFGLGTLHSELEVTTDIAAPTITNGGAVIYFHAGSPRDLYRATLKGNGTYTMPMPVTELNMPAARDASPYVVQTDDYMVFERAGDIFETTRTLP